MPFGLANSPSVFQAFINDIFRDMLNQSVIVYIDDMLIYFDTLEEHIHRVRTVLKRLIHHQLYAKLEKCEFHQTSTAFLGYIISSEGIAMDKKSYRCSQLASTNYSERTAKISGVYHSTHTIAHFYGKEREL